MITKKNALILYIAALISGFVFGRTTAPNASECVTAGEPIKTDMAHQKSSPSANPKH